MDEVHKLCVSRWDVRHWPTPTHVAFVKSETEKKKGRRGAGYERSLWWPESHHAPSEKGFPLKTPTRKVPLSLWAPSSRGSRKGNLKKANLWAPSSRGSRKGKLKKANLLSGHMFIYPVSRVHLACAVCGMLAIHGGPAVVY